MDPEFGWRGVEKRANVELLHFHCQICVLSLFLVLFLHIFNLHLCRYITKYLYYGSTKNSGHFLQKQYKRIHENV